MWDGTHDMGWWMALWMVVGWTAWVVLAALLLSLLNRRWNRTRHHPDSPLDIARRRYASGELTQDEFEAIRRNLV